MRQLERCVRRQVLQSIRVRPAVADAIGHRPHQPGSVGLAKCPGNAAHVSLEPGDGSRTASERVRPTSRS